MKNIYAFTIAFLSLALFSCSDAGLNIDNPNKGGSGSGSGNHTHDESTVQGWICSRMCTAYLWNDDVKSKSPDYTLDYASFFNSLRSANRPDGKVNSDGSRYFYSYIQRSNVGTRSDLTAERGFGFDFSLREVPLNENERYIYAVVTYVVPDSPAHRAGVRRGDYIGKIDGERMTSSDYRTKYLKLMDERYTANPASSVNLDIYRITLTDETFTIHPYTYYVCLEEQTKSVRMDAGNIVDNPLFYHTVINDNGRKVGYLVYNQFERGESNYYDNRLKEVFREFASAGIQDLVLDLRYNNGGALSSCELLTSIIAPSHLLGTPMMKLIYNQTLTESYPETYDVWKNFLTVEQMSEGSYGSGAGVNINMQRLYVLVTGSSASASELIVNTLRGADVPVYLVGSRTEGKNVGMSGYSREFDGWKYEMWPVTFYCCNLKNYYEYNGGFVADYPVSDLSLDMKELGDPKEPLLGAALTHITTGAFPASTRSGDPGIFTDMGFNSRSFSKKGGIRNFVEE